MGFVKWITDSKLCNRWKADQPMLRDAVRAGLQVYQETRKESEPIKISKEVYLSEYKNVSMMPELSEENIHSRIIFKIKDVFAFEEENEIEGTQSHEPLSGKARQELGRL